MDSRTRSKAGSELQQLSIVLTSAQEEPLWQPPRPTDATKHVSSTLRSTSGGPAPEFDAFAGLSRGAGPAVELHTSPSLAAPAARPARPSKLLSRRSSSTKALKIDTTIEVDDCGPEWSAEFSPESQTSAFLASQPSPVGGDFQQCWAAFDTGPIAAGRVFSDHPNEDEATLAQSAGLNDQILPSRGKDVDSGTAPRRAHPLTLEPSPSAAWSFERVFGRSLRHRPRCSSITDHREEGIKQVGWGAEEEMATAVAQRREDEEERRRRAAARLELIAGHLGQHGDAGG